MRDIPLIRHGTRLVCPNPDCRKPIGRFRLEILRGAPNIGIDAITFEPGQARDAGAPAVCHGCGAPFMRDIHQHDMDGTLAWRELHTSEGWLALK